jgi:hypothetical protein
VSILEALRSRKYAKAQPTAAVRRAQSRSAVGLVLTTGACLAAMLLLVVPLLTLEADARGGGGGHGGGGHGGGGHGGGGHGGGGHGASFVGHGGGHGGGKQGAGFAAHGGGRHLGHRVFGNRAIANVALQSRFGAARFHGGFSGSAWPWWRGGLVLGWFGPLFWPYAHYDLFDYVYWPYAYDDFWPYAYDDIYYGIYGPYAYYGPSGAPGVGGRGVSSRRYGGSSARYAAKANGSARRPGEVCSSQVQELTDWPIERISEVVQPTDAQRAALDELRAASAKAIDILKSGCPQDLPSIPTGRLVAMESRLQVMLAAVQTVRPALERFYQSLSDEQKARFNAIALANDPDAAGKDQRDLAKFCDEKAPGVTDLPIDRIGQAVQPTPAQRAALDELKDASVKAAERLKVSCPTYQTLTPTGRVEAMEKRLEATLDAVKTVQPALAKFYNSLSDEQQARFNSMRLASRPLGWQRRAISGTLRPAPNAPDDSMVSPKRMAAMFWPDAADDLVQYVLFPKGNDRFWQHGYDSIVGAAFAGSAIDDRRRPRSRPAPNQVIVDAATPAKVPLSSANLCGGTSAADDANALIERIEHAIGPNASQRDVLEQLRTALAQVVERIRATCPAAVPATLAERLSAIQDRIWAMRDVLLTLRLPFETFYNSLTDEQQRRLRGDAANSGKIGADVTNGRAQSVADGRVQRCVEPAAGVADSIMRAIGRAAPPAEQQRAGVEALRLRSAAMARLIASSCPTDPQPDPMGRFAAASDRLDVMLFAVMSMGPALQQLYDTLDNKQKMGLSRALRPVRRSGLAGERSWQGQ